VNSWSNLDLITRTTKRSLPKPNAHKDELKSLYDVLNSCVTTSGMRALKANLLQPCANVKVLNERLDVVGELVRNQAVSACLFDVLCP